MNITLGYFVFGIQWLHFIHLFYKTWGRGWMTKASAAGGTRKGMREAQTRARDRRRAGKEEKDEEEKRTKRTKRKKRKMRKMRKTRKMRKMRKMKKMKKMKKRRRGRWIFTWCCGAAPELAKARRLQLADASFRDKQNRLPVSAVRTPEPRALESWPLG